MRRNGRMGMGLALLGAAAAAGDYKEVDVANGGAIVGTVKLTGPAPAPAVKAVPPAQQADCKCQQVTSEELLVGAGGGVQNAVVALESIAEGKKKPGGSLVVDQKGCVFLPHVAAVVAGTEIEFKNSDDTMHNIHIESFHNDSVNQSVPGGAGPLKWTAKKAEKVKVACDVHPWMSCWVAVYDHPYYAITDDAGRFKLDQVPPGVYKVKVWHEQLGLLKTEKDGQKTVSFEVKVEAGKDATIELPAYQPK